MGNLFRYRDSHVCRRLFSPFYVFVFHRWDVRSVAHGPARRLARRLAGPGNAGVVLGNVLLITPLFRHQPQPSLPQSRSVCCVVAVSRAAPLLLPSR